MLPSFLVIGAAKSGTSSLHSYLRAHPAVFTPRLKEINYFAYPPRDNARLQFWAKTQPEYERHFAEARPGQVLGEVTPLYLTSSVAPDKIRQTIPGVKLVVILRNPVDRAYSAYLMAVRGGRQSADLQKAFACKDVHYVERGRYAHYLARYYERFEFSQIKIFKFDDLQSRPAEIVAELYGFLGVDSGFRPSLEAHNKGYMPRSAMVNRLFFSDFVRKVLKPILPEGLVDLGRRLRALNGQRPPRLPDEIRAELASFYRPDIAQLEALTRVDFSSWRDEAHSQMRPVATPRAGGP